MTAKGQCIITDAAAHPERRAGHRVGSASPGLLHRQQGRRIRDHPDQQRVGADQRTAPVQGFHPKGQAGARGATTWREAELPEGDHDDFPGRGIVSNLDAREVNRAREDIVDVVPHDLEVLGRQSPTHPGAARDAKHLGEPLDQQRSGSGHLDDHRLGTRRGNTCDANLERCGLDTLAAAVDDRRGERQCRATVRRRLDAHRIRRFGVAACRYAIDEELDIGHRDVVRRCRMEIEGRSRCHRGRSRHSNRGCTVAHRHVRMRIECVMDRADARDARPQAGHLPIPSDGRHVRRVGRPRGAQPSCSQVHAPLAAGRGRVLQKALQTERGGPPYAIHHGLERQDLHSDEVRVGVNDDFSRRTHAREGCGEHGRSIMPRLDHALRRHDEDRGIRRLVLNPLQRATQVDVARERELPGHLHRRRSAIPAREKQRRRTERERHERVERAPAGELHGRRVHHPPIRVMDRDVDDHHAVRGNQGSTEQWNDEVDLTRGLLTWPSHQSAYAGERHGLRVAKASMHPP